MDDVMTLLCVLFAFGKAHGYSLFMVSKLHRRVYSLLPFVWLIIEYKLEWKLLQISRKCTDERTAAMARFQN